MENKIKITTKEQMQRLVDLMEKNPQLARGIGHFGCTRQQITDTWARFATELNGLGPPTRTGAEWQRVWVHYKANLKRKLAKNKAELHATSGGPLQELSFSPSEERVIQLTNINKSINPSGQVLGLIEINDEDTLASHSATSAAPVSTPVVTPLATPVTTKKRPKVEDTRTVLLEEQIKIQKEMLAVHKKVKKIYKKIYKLKKQKMKWLQSAMEEEKELRAVQ